MNPMLVMNVGCQSNLWHKVLPNTSGPSTGVRYVLSFQKLKSNPMIDIEANLCTSTPMYKQMPLANGFQVHKDRVAPHHKAEPHTMASNQATASVSPLSTSKPQPALSSEPQQTTHPLHVHHPKMFNNQLLPLHSYHRILLRPRIIWTPMSIIIIDERCRNIL